MAVTDTRIEADMVSAAERGNRLIDEHEAAARLGLSVMTLRRWRWARKGVSWVKIGFSVRYDPSDISAFVDANRVSIVDPESVAT